MNQDQMNIMDTVDIMDLMDIVDNESVFIVHSVH